MVFGILLIVGVLLGCALGELWANYDFQRYWQITTVDIGTFIVPDAGDSDTDDWDSAAEVN